MANQTVPLPQSTHQGLTTLHLCLFAGLSVFVLTVRNVALSDLSPGCPAETRDCPSSSLPLSTSHQHWLPSQLTAGSHEECYLGLSSDTYQTLPADEHV